MFCPSCGHKVELTQVYCHFCRENISQVVALLSVNHKAASKSTGLIRKIGYFTIGLSLNVITFFLIVFAAQILNLREGFILLYLILASLTLSGTVSVLLFSKNKTKEIGDIPAMPHSISSMKSLEYLM